MSFNYDNKHIQKSSNYDQNQTPTHIAGSFFLDTKPKANSANPNIKNENVNKIRNSTQSLRPEKSNQIHEHRELSTCLKSNLKNEGVTSSNVEKALQNIGQHNYSQFKNATLDLPKDRNILFEKASIIIFSSNKFSAKDVSVQQTLSNLFTVIKNLDDQEIKEKQNGLGETKDKTSNAVFYFLKTKSINNTSESKTYGLDIVQTFSPPPETAFSGPQARVEPINNSSHISQHFEEKNGEQSYYFEHRIADLEDSHKKVKNLAETVARDNKSFVTFSAALERYLNCFNNWMEDSENLDEPSKVTRSREGVIQAWAAYSSSTGNDEKQTEKVKIQKEIAREALWIALKDGKSEEFSEDAFKDKILKHQSKDFASAEQILNSISDKKIKKGFTLNNLIGNFEKYKSKLSEHLIDPAKTPLREVKHQLDICITAADNYISKKKKGKVVSDEGLKIEFATRIQNLGKSPSKVQAIIKFNLEVVDRKSEIAQLQSASKNMSKASSINKQSMTYKLSELYNNLVTAYELDNEADITKIVDEIREISKKWLESNSQKIDYDKDDGNTKIYKKLRAVSDGLNVIDNVIGY